MLKAQGITKKLNNQILFEKIFLEMLSEAKSNKKEFLNGKDLYLKKVRKP